MANLSRLSFFNLSGFGPPPLINKSWVFFGRSNKCIIIWIHHNFTCKVLLEVHRFFTRLSSLLVHRTELSLGTEVIGHRRQVWLATGHPMAWLACTLLLLTSANRLILGLSALFHCSTQRCESLWCNPTERQTDFWDDKLRRLQGLQLEPSTCCPRYNREPPSKPARTLLSYELKRSKLKRNWRSNLMVVQNDKMAMTKWFI